MIYLYEFAIQLFEQQAQQFQKSSI